MAEPQDDKKVITEEKIEDHVISVDRTPEIKGMQDDLGKKEAELIKLHADLKERDDRLADLEVENKTKTDDYEAEKAAKEEIQGQLTEIALEKFNVVKGEVRATMLAGGVTEEQLEDFDEKVSTPEELERIKWFYDKLADQLNKAQEPGDDDGDNGGDDGGDDGGDNGGDDGDDGTPPPVIDPSKPPDGSVVTLPQTQEKKWVYANARDAIDDLYEKLQNGTDEEKKFAEKAIQGYFNKLKPTLDAGKLGSFSMTACPGCGFALLAGTDTCPYCELNIAKYRSRGGEFY